MLEIMKYSDTEGQFSSGTSIMESLHTEHLILENYFFFILKGIA